MEYRIGKVVKAHGIQGEVVIEVTTDAPEERFYVGAVLSGRQAGREIELTVAALRWHKGRILAKFEEIPDRNGAESLRGTQFFAEPLDHDVETDGYYDHELEGLDVIKGGTVIGTVTAADEGPAGTLLTVTIDGREVLIPFVEQIVPEVDLEAGHIVITPPDGLLDL